MGEADRDADRPRLRDDRPEDAEPDRALREPCGDGVRRRLRELRPDEAEPERPESVRRRRRVGVRGGVLIGCCGHFRAVFRAGSWSGRGAAYVDVLDALYGSVATRGLPSAGAGAAQGRVLPALSRRIWPCNAPGAAAGLRISIKEAPTRRSEAARVDRVPLTTERAAHQIGRYWLVERRGGATPPRGSYGPTRDCRGSS